MPAGLGWGRGKDFDGAEEIGVISSINFNAVVSLVLSPLQREKRAGASWGIQERKVTGGGWEHPPAVYRKIHYQRSCPWAFADAKNSGKKPFSGAKFPTERPKSSEVFKATVAACSKIHCHHWSHHCSHRWTRTQQFDGPHISQQKRCLQGCAYADTQALLATQKYTGSFKEL